MKVCRRQHRCLSLCVCATCTHVTEDCEEFIIKWTNSRSCFVAWSTQHRGGLIDGHAGTLTAYERPVRCAHCTVVSRSLVGGKHSYNTQHLGLQLYKYKHQISYITTDLRFLPNIWTTGAYFTTLKQLYLGTIHITWGYTHMYPLRYVCICVDTQLSIVMQLIKNNDDVHSY